MYKIQVLCVCWCVLVCVCVRCLFFIHRIDDDTIRPKTAATTTHERTNERPPTIFAVRWKFVKVRLTCTFSLSLSFSLLEWSMERHILETATLYSRVFYVFLPARAFAWCVRSFTRPTN